jgi:hypothetical protein
MLHQAIVILKCFMHELHPDDGDYYTACQLLICCDEINDYFKNKYL